MFEAELARAAGYVAQMRIPQTWRFRNSGSGQDTVYASCFAAMSWHYAGELHTRTTAAERAAWAEYINSFQDAATGLFLVPEIMAHTLTSADHDVEHLQMHFCAHVLPALAVLGSKPAFPLKFAHRFVQPEQLDAWLDARDWRRAWIEGNNLLFVGQFLIHLEEVEKLSGSGQAVQRMLDWLDSKLDPATGLWGTDGYCDLYAALYGGYHQLLLYYYLERPLLHAPALVDSVLSLQHFDGGFHRYRGGGTCQDVDAVDVLVNVYKRCEWRRRDIRRSLRRASQAVRARQCVNGGFLDRAGQAFNHMGMAATRAAPGEPNMFSTWFGTHTLALIREVLDPPTSNSRAREAARGFNSVCSMGWHDSTLIAKGGGSPFESLPDSAAGFLRRSAVRLYAFASTLRATVRRVTT